MLIVLPFPCSGVDEQETAFCPLTRMGGGMEGENSLNISDKETRKL